MSNENLRYFVNAYNEDNSKRIDHNFLKSKILDFVQDIKKQINPVSKSAQKGLYTGNAGIAYALYYLSKCGHIHEKKTKYLELAKSYIEIALNKENLRLRKPVGFLSGNSGVYVVAALIFHQLNLDKEFNKYIEEFVKLASNFETANSDELFVGRAGYILGILIIKQELNIEVMSRDHINKLCKIILLSGQQTCSELGYNDLFPLMYQYHGKPYLGAAHGVSGIFFTLLSFPHFLEISTSKTAIKTTVDFLLSNCIKNGNIATNLNGALSENDGKYLVHWCHGATGIIYMFARAYLVFNKDDKYLKVCRELSDTVWEKGLLKKGPGICHGIAGSGYVFLLMYRLTGEEKYLIRAERFAKFLFTEEFSVGSRLPDKPYSLFEGTAGTVCFLNDLLNPTNANFPFMNVFGYM